MKYTIEKIDFDEAVAIPFSAQTCLFAQAAKRLQLESAYVFTEVSPLAKRLMMRFDGAYGPKRRIEPVNKRVLKRIRASLPIEINLP